MSAETAEPIPKRITSMGVALSEVAAFQPLYTSFTTPEMQIRGKLVRRTIPQLLESAMQKEQVRVPKFFTDLKISASDGISAKAEIPWVRVHSASLAPRATAGRYLVYLFDNLGKTAFLSLSSGAMKLEKGRYVPRPAEALAQVVEWAREVVSEQTDITPYTVKPRLGNVRSNLGRTYEKSSIACIPYKVANLPSDQQIWSDLTLFLDLLAQIHQAETDEAAIPTH
ncbi:MAG: DUF3578 domain-containing protein [Cyanobacteria bacterium P01_D01_bin.14]